MRIFIGNLHFGTTEDEIVAWFLERSWRVTNVHIVTERNTGSSRGFAFGECDDDLVVKDMDGQPLHGRKINVTVARPREEQRKQAHGHGRRGSEYDEGKYD